VGFSYDTANRRSTLTLSNGVNMSYTYDNDSRVTGITYKFNANTLGNLTYSYDSLGRRTQVGGSFAQTGLPTAVTSATYDAANELTNWNGTLISYDLNGNMLSDGDNSFAWNARDQVAALNSVSLQYDSFGRRTKNLQNTSFLYNGANAVQELSGSTPTANLISGGIDEIFARADSAGTVTPLKDALGSTIALVDASGNLVTQFAYDPFGNTTVSGAASSNAFQYTGRENEGNGLYFYRARYYSPLLGRFISPDPIGFTGGVNSYRYAYDSPPNANDPTGLWSPGAHDVIFDTALAGCATQSDINAIKAYSREFDNNTTTNPKLANVHSMLMPNQGYNDFFSQRDGFINGTISVAHMTEMEGNHPGALAVLAQGMHTTSDSYSPMHTDPNGLPYTWECAVCSWNNFRHSPNEYWGGETISDYWKLPQDVRDHLQQDLINEYKKAFGGCTAGRKS
jgi:RHS repeat-associated core domain